MNIDTALKLLGISERNPSVERINSAYHAAMQMCHPDRYANNETLRAHAEEQCKLINEAREVLLSRNWEHDVGKDESYYARECDAPQNHQSSYSYSERADVEQDTKNNDSQDCGTNSGEQAVSSPSVEASLLSEWSTSIGYSIAGLLAWIVLEAFFRSAENASFLGSVVITIIEAAYMISQLVYATYLYPSYFGNKPRIDEPKMIAFLNCMFGSVVFGLVWNSNLTKGQKGVSHIVFTVLASLHIAVWIFSFGALFMYLSAQ